MSNPEKNTDISVDFAGINLKNPVLTASGTFGYGDELCDFLDVNKLGGIITKSITPLPRKGNPPERIVETDSGMLNAIGLANIGLEKFITEKLPILEKFDTKIFVNAAGKVIDDYIIVVERLSEFDCIAGFELNISCPNVKQGGIAFGTNPKNVSKITKKVKKNAKNKPLIVKLSPNVTDISEIAESAADAGADALSLVNTFTAMAIDIETRNPQLANKTGGLSGPAIKPIALYMVNKVYRDVAVKYNIPLLGLGGIRNSSDAVEFMIAGATAVAVGCANFVNPQCTMEIIKGIKTYCLENGIEKIDRLVGSLKEN
jgi:dihydroorotate dehydrogenase (NAD+) catalytic subunit